MGERTEIAWTDSTWNPVRGCSEVSPGCANCYARGVAARFADDGKPFDGFARINGTNGRHEWTGKVALLPEKLDEPLHWKKPRRVFVNSMSDLFHEGMSDEEIDKVFAVMACATWHTFQVLTKRADRMREYLTVRSRSAQPWKDAARSLGYSLEFEGISLVPFPLPNVWLGVSVEDQRHADERIPLLLQTPAAVRFVSAEPLLGPIDPTVPYLRDGDTLESWARRPHKIDALRGYCDNGVMRKVDWVIVGGESGPKARPCRVDEIRSIVCQCKRAGVKCFVKQLGSYIVDRNDAGFEADLETYADGPMAGLPSDSSAWPSPREVEHDIHGYREEYQGADVRVRTRHPKGGDPTEWPMDLRVREFPEVTRG